MDPRQLSDWFTAYSDRLALYARQWLEPGLAEDAVQEVFLRMSSLQKEPTNVPAWLFRSIRNAAMTQLRSRRRRDRHERQRTAERSAWFEAQTDGPLDPGEIQGALEKLPDDQREIVVLRIWGKLTLRDIGEIVNRPTSSVHCQYQCALDALRKVMEKCHER